MTTQIWSTVDFDAKGVQTGDLCLPHSVHRSAYGVIPIPVAVVNGAPGPTLLLTGGTHGDEYEGPIAIRRLLCGLDPASLKGRVIALPMLNAPAFRAGLRTSPEDGGNLNRAYPGDPQGGPTSAIAHYMSSVLLPMADYFHDIHAGGSSLQYQPFVSIRRSGDVALDQAALSAARAFGAERILIWDYSPDPRLSTSESNRQKVVSLGGEFGGGGSVSRPGVALVEAGLRRVMAHWGMIEDAPAAPGRPARELQIKTRDYYVYATRSGVFEPAVDLGTEIAQGDLAGQVWSTEDLADRPSEQFFRHDGTVLCLRHPGLVQRGDCLAHLATEVPQ
ncbi:succinylglutamate desuccinylase/aspartoacylase family protein [Pseudodonghicola sp.]|uniref:succinylglutamate desuccinylase/aspartoacylase family protein n=1 Tax=Pseudodonghicola sp. TaxID=1969463 RepID=UPI003A980E44